ncbi:MAG: aminotransferase class I/II-fold pyridoxal phosphate-dependent enzyme [Blastocatellia bacterium]
MKFTRPRNDLPITMDDVALNGPNHEGYAPPTLEQIGEIARDVGARVLVDEVYRDILFEDSPPVAASLGSQFITTSSLTKSYGLHGLRCGWILKRRAISGWVSR